MPGRDLASLASGLTETFFGGLAEQRRSDQERKDKETAMQLAALHSLLESEHTPINSIPDIMMAQAKLLKAEKEFGPIAQHLSQAIAQHAGVPTGDKRETTKSIVNRMTEASTAPGATTTTLDVQPNYKPEGITPAWKGVPYVSDEGQGDYYPRTFTPPPPSAPVTVETPALRSVPMEPEMYQPTRAYGELSQGEAKSARESQAYIQNQGAMLERQSALAEAADRARLARQDDQQAAAENLAKLKAEETRKTQNQLFENKVKMLDPVLQSKAKLRVAQIVNALDPSIPMEQRQQQARELAMAEIQVAVDQKKQQIAQSKAQMERMKVLNSKDVEQIKVIQNKGTGVADGLSAAGAREFGMRTSTLRMQMSSIMQQLEAAYRGAAGVPTPAEQANIDRLEAEKSDLWGKIDSVRNELLSRSGGGSRAPAAPLSPEVEKTLRDKAAARGLDPDIAVQKARARQ